MVCNKSRKMAAIKYRYFLAYVLCICMIVLKSSCNPGETCDEKFPEVDNARPRGKNIPPFTANTVIRYDCRPGFYATQGLIIAKCELQGNSLKWAMLTDSKCIYVSCGHPGDIANGKRIGENFTFGKGVTYVCNPGFRRRGVGTIYCNTNGKWTRSPPVCEKDEVTCPHPTEDGSIEISDPSGEKGRRHRVGKKLVFKCPNDKLKATVCLPDGTWSVEPRCAGGTCSEDIPKFENARPNNNRKPPFKVNTLIRYRCNPGFQQAGEGLFAICKQQSDYPTWVASDGKCRRRSCGDPGDIENGKRIGENFTFGKGVKYVCNLGFKRRGVGTIYCNTNGKWTHKPPVCEKDEATCPHPTEDGSIEISGTSGEKARYPSGKKIFFKCPKGKLRGTICLPDGTWSIEPKCARDTCSEDIPKFENARPIQKYLPPFKVRAVIRYRCTPGFYQAGGGLYAICKEQNDYATWVESDGKCRHKSCGHPGDIVNGRRIGEDFRFGKSVTYQCYPGYKMKGVATIFCGANEQWTWSAPRCLPAYLLQ